MTTNARRNYSVDEILVSSWDRKLAKDLAEEIEICTGDKRGTIEEMRRFLALKGYRELIQRLREAREGKHAEEAITAVAKAIPVVLRSRKGSVREVLQKLRG